MVAASLVLVASTFKHTHTPTHPHQKTPTPYFSSSSSTMLQIYLLSFPVSFFLGFSLLFHRSYPQKRGASISRRLQSLSLFWVSPPLLVILHSCRPSASLFHAECSGISFSLSFKSQTPRSLLPSLDPSFPSLAPSLLH